MAENRNNGTHPLKKVLFGANGTRASGIASICSASELVIDATLEFAKESGGDALIEATANQVNQFGGYTGQRPADFARKVYGAADRIGLPRERVILGGDHLGPLVWKDEDAEAAMAKAADLVAEFVAAGFTKIHLDTSMRLACDDPKAPLTDGTIAKRAVRLAKRIEAANSRGAPLALVIGSEVPIPGGEQLGDGGLQVTSPQAFSAMVDTFRAEFAAAGLSSLWDSVVGAVVQPGVEFGDSTVHYYDRTQAAALTEELKKHTGLVFEGHSTDYQPAGLMRRMVEDGIKILKVGPMLTFYQREALYALELIERELIPASSGARSDFRQVLDRAMVSSPVYWKKYYGGSEAEMAFKRSFSFSDRCRYYLPEASVAASAEKLLGNLAERELPLSVVSQYLPKQAELISAGALESEPRALVRSRIQDCIKGYAHAAGLAGY